MHYVKLCAENMNLNHFDSTSLNKHQFYLSVTYYYMILYIVCKVFVYTPVIQYSRDTLHLIIICSLLWIISWHFVSWSFSCVKESHEVFHLAVILILLHHCYCKWEEHHFFLNVSWMTRGSLKFVSGLLTRVSPKS